MTINQSVTIIMRVISEEYQITLEELVESTTRDASSARRWVCYFTNSPALDKIVVTRLKLSGLNHFRKNVERLNEELGIYADTVSMKFRLKAGIRNQIKKHEFQTI